MHEECLPQRLDVGRVALRVVDVAAAEDLTGTFFGAIDPDGEGDIKIERSVDFAKYH